MQCECANEMKEDCLNRLKYFLLNADKTNEHGNKIEYITGDMQTYLNEGEEHETNKELLDIRNVFRGIVLKNWKGN